MGIHGCPLSRKQTNTYAARINAIFAVILVVISIFWINIWIPLFLTIDFFILGFLEKPSPRSFIAKKITKLFKKGKIVNAGPKIFAAKIGFWASLIITVCAFYNWIFTYYFIAGILTAAAGAEACFEFCLGCKIFPFWIRFKGIWKK
jgi:hypothetical protein